jgi:hypothetical protein
MIQLHPKFLTQDGQKVAILPYDEFLKVQEILEDLEDLEDLRQAKEEAKDSPTYSLEEVNKILNEDNLSASGQEIDDNISYKAWQPCNPYDAVEKLTNLLEIDNMNNND